MHPATDRDHHRPFAEDGASDFGAYLARTRGLAEQAIFNFENSPRTKFANQLQTSTEAASAQKENAMAINDALPERGVTVHSGDMGYTIGPFAGSARCPGRCVNLWMNG